MALDLVKIQKGILAGETAPHVTWGNECQLFTLGQLTAFDQDFLQNDSKFVSESQQLSQPRLTNWSQPK